MNWTPRRDFLHEAQVRMARQAQGLEIDYPRHVWKWQRPGNEFAGYCSSRKVSGHG